jgi:hypothetical protein
MQNRTYDTKKTAHALDLSRQGFAQEVEAAIY